MGVARIFQRGGHTVSNIIVLAFSPQNIIGCFLKKKKAYKGGVTGTPGPPRYALAMCRLYENELPNSKVILNMR